VGDKCGILKTRDRGTEAQRDRGNKNKGQRGKG